jgi:hypothetical protein
MAWFSGPPPRKRSARRATTTAIHPKNTASWVSTKPTSRRTGSECFDATNAYAASAPARPSPASSTPTLTAMPGKKMTARFGPTRSWIIALCRRSPQVKRAAVLRTKSNATRILSPVKRKK